MRQFFETLKTLTEPRVIIYYKVGPYSKTEDAVMVIDKGGIEDLTNDIFKGEAKLLWEEIARIDCERMRLGRFHIPLIRFANEETLLNRLTCEKAAKVKSILERSPNAQTIPLSKHIKFHIESTEHYAPMEELSATDRVDVLTSIISRFSDIPVGIIEDRDTMAALAPKEPRNLKELELLAKHRRKMSKYENVDPSDSFAAKP